jgi:hypothetical protein
LQVLESRVVDFGRIQYQLEHFLLVQIAQTFQSLVAGRPFRSQRDDQISITVIVIEEVS